MTAHGPSPRSRLLPTLLGLLLILAALAMSFGGVRLLTLGGSPYYLIGGLVLGLAGLLLVLGKSSALLVYGLFLLGSTAWALWEAGLDWWQLVPRLALWFAIGIVLLLPWLRHPLGDREHRARLGSGLTALGVVAAGVIALASLVMPPRGEIDGELSRAPAPIDNPAPQADPGDWPSYGRTAFGQRYSPLDQITPDNAERLELAWSYRTGDIPGPDDPQETTAENTPLKVNGMLYVCTPHSQVIALDPDTGKEIWRFDPKLSTQHAESFKGWAHMTCRGVAYHDEAAYGAPAPSGPDLPEGACTKRLFLPTADTRLIALNADTGKPCPRFGQSGSVDLATGIGDFNPGGYYSTSPPSVTRDLVIIGGHVTDNVSLDEPSGVIRAYDVRSGELVWNWDSGNPEQTEPLPEGQTYTRNSPNMWSVMSVDEDLGLIYLPMGNATPDQWGGHRTPAMERYSAGITALDIATGQVRWVFQTTHHDLWDMDVGGQPSLTDIQTPQGPRPALVASTKQGSVYVLDRRTGEPILPVEERPVPQGAAEGDWTAPTQPFSRLDLQPPLMQETDMWGVTPFDQLLCRITFKSLRYDGIYTPPSEQGSLVNPGNFGVFDWGGVSIDPARQIVFMNPSYMAFTSQLVPSDQVGEGQRISETEGVQPNKGAPFGVILQPLLSPLGLPCQAPAWGYVAAADLTTGELIYKRRNGTIRDSSPIPLPIEMGVPSLGGTITTAGGVGFLSGTLDQYLRAYDLNTGEELWKGRLPAGGQTTPMTYTGADGRQYVLVMAGGHGSLGTRQGDYVLAFALPDDTQ
ncbi:glucose/quinate/shikimate family membrane-bound PQQ-dependent dehydrogenase [Stutzerimonas azotifigens]|uniref:glucose/quinate/shikimate family membrane-bound PQQ-dependent dehydrogenase n=1 Tax=Stutzerimonas azotifigens TaxID=291995 RepID=UPI0003FBC912|nr:glucose/quinate/shikimate family membrane-bound PQQ-dependent dehydrogenase [Stutzerimonas azotifigens]